MKTRREDFEPFVDGNFEQHLAMLMTSRTYGGHDSIVAFARLHKVHIVIHQLGVDPWVIKCPDDKWVKQLHISYHHGEH